ncbi:MAG: hypothetical protein HYW90_03380 [Candidatus Sungbacteria bacterium]|nr:hypothetical protein [Candidatus Sungbacteria bacterium]
MITGQKTQGGLMKFLTGAIWFGSLLIAFGVGYTVASGDPSLLGTVVAVVGMTITVFFGTVKILVWDQQNPKSSEP